MEKRAIIFVLSDDGEYQNSTIEHVTGHKTDTVFSFEFQYQSNPEEVLNDIRRLDDIRLFIITNQHIACSLKRRKCIIDAVNNLYPDFEFYASVNAQKSIQDVDKKWLCSLEVPFPEEGIKEIQVLQSKDIMNENMFDMMNGFNQENPNHSLTLDQHCTKSAMNLSKVCGGKYFIPNLFLAMSIHDIGKVFVKTWDEDSKRARYMDHDKYGAYYILSRTYDFVVKEELHNRYTQFTPMIYAFVACYHMQPYTWNEEKTLEKKRRLFGDKMFDILMAINEADKSAK